MGSEMCIRDSHDAEPIVVKALQEYAWPGNIRELENVIERAYILEDSSVLRAESFPQEIFSGFNNSTKVATDLTKTLAEVRRQGVEHLERNYLKELLKEHKGRINRASETAGITTRQLHKLLTKHRIRKEDFKGSQYVTT